MHLSFPLLLCGMAAVARASSCSSSSTCPAHEDNRDIGCLFKGINNMWGFSSLKNMNFPGIGLYTLARVSKDTSDCCYDLEVQAFLGNAMRGGNRVRSQPLAFPV